jgi:hypothetical protein
MSLSSVKKSVINVLTLVVTVGPLILQVVGAIHLDPAVLGAVTGVLALAGSALHYLSPNTTTDATVAATQSVKLVTPNAA